MTHPISYFISKLVKRFNDSIWNWDADSPVVFLSDDTPVCHVAQLIQVFQSNSSFLETFDETFRQRWQVVTLSNTEQSTWETSIDNHAVRNVLFCDRTWTTETFQTTCTARDPTADWLHADAAASVLPRVPRHTTRTSPPLFTFRLTRSRSNFLSSFSF